MSGNFIRAELRLRVDSTLTCIVFPGSSMQTRVPACNILSPSIILSLCNQYHLFTETRLIEHILCVHQALCEVLGTQARKVACWAFKEYTNKPVPRKRRMPRDVL